MILVTKTSDHVVCMYVCTIITSSPTFLCSAEEEKHIFPVVPIRSSLKIRSHETGSAALSRVSRFIPHAQTESGAYLPTGCSFSSRFCCIYMLYLYSSTVFSHITMI